MHGTPSAHAWSSLQHSIVTAANLVCSNIELDAMVILQCSLHVFAAMQVARAKRRWQVPCSRSTGGEWCWMNLKPSKMAAPWWHMRPTASRYWLLLRYHLSNHNTGDDVLNVCMFDCGACCIPSNVCTYCALTCQATSQGTLHDHSREQNVILLCAHCDIARAPCCNQVAACTVPANQGVALTKLTDTRGNR